MLCRGLSTLLLKWSHARLKQSLEAVEHTQRQQLLLRRMQRCQEEHQNRHHRPESLRLTFWIS